MATSWDSVFQAIQGQGKSPGANDPKSPSNCYFAYLDKADLDLRDDLWYLMFDMIPAEATLLALAGDTGAGLPPPTLPTIIFHATGVTPAAVVEALQLQGKEDPAEGSWYALFLESGDRADQVVGDLYHPDLDFIPSSPDYGRWYISAAQILFLPVPPTPKTLFAVASSRPSYLRAGGARPRTFDALRRTVRLSQPNRFKPARRPLRLRNRVVRAPPPPPPLPPPGYGALGVMAIGQGGFNLVMDRPVEPAFYYDTGYPLGFFHNTLMPAMRFGNPAFQGPIYQNAAANLSVILSHWDWDHWRFGAFPGPAGNGLGSLPWTVPVQPMSPTAAIFLATVAVVNSVPVGTPPQAIGVNGLTLFKMNPPGGVPAAFIINNSGLAIRLPVDLAGLQSAPVLLTGDGNINLLPAPAQAALRVIGAVHHGSNNHGAAAGLPGPAGGAGGRIAYSYGVSSVTGNHAYGFPHPAAVAAYQAAAWGPPNQQGTAEGPNINVGPTAPGNVRVGNQGALAPAYGASAFFPIAYTIP